MKRSEMIDHIKEELLELRDMRKYSNETDENYYKRKADSLLAMIEGMGMLPPNYCIKTEDTELGYTTGVMSYYIDGNTNWEKEDT